MSAILALAAAKKAGVKLTLDGDGIVLETKTPPLPADVVALLKASKPDILHVLEWREAARATLTSEPPPDARKEQWSNALRGLHHFVLKGWGDQAALMGWSKEELYRVPPRWARIDLCGCAVLVGDKRVIAVTEDSIVIEQETGSRNRFRRLGKEHLA
jgi:hypothetical protein